MMKFKKFLAAAMTGAMMFGTVAMAVPAVSVIAAVEEAKASYVKIESWDSEEEKTTTPVTILRPGDEGYYTAQVVYDNNKLDSSVTWSIEDNKSNSTKISDVEIIDEEEVIGTVEVEGYSLKKLEIGADETAESIVLKAISQTTSSVVASLKIRIGKGVTLNVDYTDMTGVIRTTGEDSFVFLEVLKDKGATKPGTTYCYEVSENEVNVDLSFLKLSKEAYVRVFGDKNTKPLEVVTIAKQEKKPSIKYVAGKDKFAESFTLNKSALDNAKIANLQWKTQYGNEWNDFSELENTLSNLSVAGTTLLVRQITQKDGTCTAPPTAEVKVKISASPKAPKVTLDYAKNSIKLPKDSVIQVPDGMMTLSGSAINFKQKSFEYTVGSAKEDLTVAPMTLAEKLVTEFVTKYNADDLHDDLTEADKKNLLANMANGYSILVRTNSKKGVSQPTFVEVKAAPSIKLSTVSGSAIGSGTISVMTEKGASATDNVAYKYEDKGLTLTPTGSYTFSYSVDGGEKFKKLTKATTIAYKNIDKSKKVVVRTEGTKEDTKKKVVGNWASNTETVPVNPAKIVVTVPSTSVTNNATSGVTIQPTAAVKDDLGNDVTGKTFTWTIAGLASSAINANTGVVTVPSTFSGDITITATCTDDTKIKGEVKVTVAAPTSNAQ